MSSVRESVQPELQPHHTQQETHRIQTVRLRPVRQRLPEEGGPEEAQRDTTRPEMKRSEAPSPPRVIVCLQTNSVFCFFYHPPRLRTFLGSRVTFIFGNRVYDPHVYDLYQLGSSLFIYFNKNRKKNPRRWICVII